MERESRRYGTGGTRFLTSFPRLVAYRVPQRCNLDGISMNIQEENSALYFRVQSEREQTLVVVAAVLMLQ